MATVNNATHKKIVMAQQRDVYSIYFAVREYSNKDSSGFFYLSNFRIIVPLVCENAATRAFCEKSFAGIGYYPYPNIISRVCF